MTFSSVLIKLKTIIRIGITGKPRIGKSTIIKAVIKRWKAEGIAVGGMLTADMREGGVRVGFSLEDINTGEKGILAHTHVHHRPTGPKVKVGKYTVNLADLDSIGANSTRKQGRNGELDYSAV